MSVYVTIKDNKSVGINTNDELVIMKHEGAAQVELINLGRANISKLKALHLALERLFIHAVDD